MKLTSMKLYYKPECPYCKKVLDFMADNDLSVDMLDTNDPKYKEELVNLTEKTQVPCLVVGDHPILESDDIIAFLKEMLTHVE